MRTRRFGLFGWKHGASVALMVALSASAGEAAATKFYAWQSFWHDSPIPAQLLLDERTDRQYVGSCNTVAQYNLGGCGVTTAVAAAFATAHPGHLYYIGDEPNAYYGVTPALYAELFHLYATAIATADPTARFSSAGIAEDFYTLDAHTIWADQFIVAYQTAYGAPPPISEWRFNISEQTTGNPPPAGFPAGTFTRWQDRITQAAAWSAAKGKPVALSFGLLWPDTHPVGWNPIPLMTELLNQVQADPRISALIYWHHDYAPLSNYLLFDDTTWQLTALGQLYASYALSAGASTAGSGLSALGDFTGDHYADFGDHYVPGGQFYLHRNLQNGTFDTANWATGMSNTGGGSSWQVLTGDFTGDGKADFVDIHTGNGNYYIHRNLGNGTFETTNWSTGTLRAGADFEQLTGDFDHDGWTDFAERQLSTGLLWVRLNPQVGGGAVFNYTNIVNVAVHGNMAFAVARTLARPDFRTVIADFNGDGYADYADQHIPTGQFWIHYNSSTPGRFYMDTVSHGYGSNTAGWLSLFADFTGDGFADFADLSPSSGTFYIHRNLQNGSFTGVGLDWGSGQSLAVSGWSVFGSK
jgi:hypothetical protein